MTIQSILNETVETLRNVAALADVPVIREDVGNINAELAAKVARQNVCIVVGWDTLTPIIQGPTAPDAGVVGTVGIVASVFEKPLVNRATPGRKSIGDLALIVADALHGAAAEDMESPLYFKGIGRVADLGENSGVVTCDVKFETKASLK